MYDYVGSNKVGENVVIEEGLPTLEFMELGDDVYIGPMAATTSHVVEGTYQALSIYTIKFGDNVALGPRVCIAPGVKMGDDSQVLYFGGLTKLQKVRKGKDQFGVPSSRISHSKYTSVLDMPEDIQKESKDLFRERRRKMKKKRRERRAKRKKEKEKNN